MTAKSAPHFMDWVGMDAIRVTTEAVSSGAIPLCPGKRLLFEKHEVVRICGERDGLVFFAVPYLCDPASTLVPQHALWERDFRSLNPAERACLGLPLHDGWDFVTRYGYGSTRDFGRYRHAPDVYPGGPHDGWESAPILDPNQDPRDFEIGQLFARSPENLPACQRELHRWPVVGRVDSRPLGGGFWEPVCVGGREALQLNPVDAKGVLHEAERHEYGQRNRAQYGAVQHTFREFRISWWVTLPQPYEAGAAALVLQPTRSGLQVPVGSRSLSFRVSQRGTQLGRVFVNLEETQPWRAAFDATRHLADGSDGFECHGPVPSESEAVGYVPANAC